MLQPILRQLLKLSGDSVSLESASRSRVLFFIVVVNGCPFIVCSLYIHAPVLFQNKTKDTNGLVCWLYHCAGGIYKSAHFLKTFYCTLKRWLVGWLCRFKIHGCFSARQWRQINSAQNSWHKNLFRFNRSAFHKTNSEQYHRKKRGKPCNAIIQVGNRYALQLVFTAFCTDITENKPNINGT